MELKFALQFPHEVTTESYPMPDESDTKLCTLFLKTDFSINPVLTEGLTGFKFPRKNFKQAAPQYRLIRR